MTESEEWLRQDMVDTKADEVLAERECAVEEVKPYWVGKKFGIKPNGAFCLKVYDWRRRRQAEADRPSIDVPPEVISELRESIARFNAELMASFMRTVRMIGGDIDRVAMLRVTDAERRRDQIDSDLVDMGDICQIAEAALADALARIAQLELKLDEARSREDRLVGRLEQREVDAGAKAAASVAPPVIVATTTGDGNDALSSVPDPDTPGQSAIAPKRPPSEQSLTPPAIENGEGQRDDGG